MKRKSTLFKALGLLCLVSAAFAQKQINLESLDLSVVPQAWGKPQINRSVEGKPLSIGGKTYQNGVGSHSRSEIMIDLNGQGIRFEAQVGVDDEVAEKGSVVFEIWGDGKRLAVSPIMRGKQAAHPMKVTLNGVKKLTLAVEEADDGNEYDHANWANAVITVKPNVKTLQTRPLKLESPVLAKPDLLKPRINFPRVTGVSPERELLFTVPTSGQRPMRFKASNLPPKLKLNEETGLLSGVIRKPGTYKIEVTVTNTYGVDKKTITIECGKDKLARTPPMGWNPWNVWACLIDDKKVREAIDAFDKHQLAAHGYQYVNLDDCWEGKRDSKGEIQTNEKFPDMRALADYAHSKGLKFGIYSSPGPKTCAGYEGSFRHEFMDARTYAAWGIDYLKYDWCSYQSDPKGERLSEFKKPYQIMQKALEASGRDIVYSLCQYGMGDVWEWGESVGGNLWRTTGDIFDTWESMSAIGFKQHEASPYAKPGHWNDPDMLLVGKVGWGAPLRDARLAPIEQQTHFTLWCLIAAPLLLGCDLTQLDEWTLNLITNDEVIAIDQDPLGKAATRLEKTGPMEIWTRPLEGGNYAVGFFNRSSEPREMELPLSKLGIETAQPIRDLWEQKSLPNTNHIKVLVPAHGSKLLRIGKISTN